MTDSTVHVSEATTEGTLEIPASTSIEANGYLVLTATDATEIPGAVVCTDLDSFVLSNTGDNLALYNGTGAGATLIDGSLSTKYPDLAGPGTSVEKKEVFQWTQWPGAWEASIVPCPYNSSEFEFASPNAENGLLPPTPTPASAVDIWEVYR